MVDPARRYTADDVLAHPWFKVRHTPCYAVSVFRGAPMKRGALWWRASLDAHPRSLTRCLSHHGLSLRHRFNCQQRPCSQPTRSCSRPAPSVASRSILMKCSFARLWPFCPSHVDAHVPRGCLLPPIRAVLHGFLRWCWRGALVSLQQVALAAVALKRFAVTPSSHAAAAASSPPAAVPHASQEAPSDPAPAARG